MSIGHSYGCSSGSCVWGDWGFGDFQSLKTTPGEHPQQPIEPSHLDPPRRHRCAQDLEHIERVVPADARVGDALTVVQLGRQVFAGAELLRAGMQVALDHHAEDVPAAAADLRGDVARDVDLLFVLLAAVAMR